MVIKTIEKESVTGSQIAGIIMLGLPYIVIMTPRMRVYFVDIFRAMYFHDSPRTEWNNAVDPYQPRRLRGYILSMILLGLPPALLFKGIDTSHVCIWTFFCRCINCACIYLSIIYSFLNESHCFSFLILMRFSAKLSQNKIGFIWLVLYSIG